MSQRKQLSVTAVPSITFSLVLPPPPFMRSSLLCWQLFETEESMFRKLNHLFVLFYIFKKVSLQYSSLNTRGDTHEKLQYQHKVKGREESDCNC